MLLLKPPQIFFFLSSRRLSVTPDCYFCSVFSFPVVLCGCQARDKPGAPLCLLPNRLDKKVEQGENANDTWHVICDSDSKGLAEGVALFIFDGEQWPQLQKNALFITIAIMLNNMNGLIIFLYT